MDRLYDEQDLRMDMIEYLNEYGIYNVLAKYATSPTTEGWLKGEIGENLLECYVLDALASIDKTRDEDRVIIRNIKIFGESKKNTLGEFDLGIVTPHRFNLIECKNWRGGVVISEKCRIRNCGGKNGCDIYRKTDKLVKQLSRGLASAILTQDKAKYSLGLFLTNHAKIHDLRKDEYRKQFPVLDETTIRSYIRGLYKNTNKAPAWDLSGVRFSLQALKEQDNIDFLDVY